MQNDCVVIIKTCKHDHDKKQLLSIKAVWFAFCKEKTSYLVILMNSS